MVAGIAVEGRAVTGDEGEFYYNEQEVANGYHTEEEREQMLSRLDAMLEVPPEDVVDEVSARRHP